jgi:hypothetical protein
MREECDIYMLGYLTTRIQLGGLALQPTLGHTDTGN